MPRRARVEASDVAHHVTARCPSGRRLFVDPTDYRQYLALLEREVRSRRWQLLTYCLMTNHIHLLLMTPASDLGDGLHRAHGDFARYSNDRHDAHGHVFGGRFHNRLVASEAHLVACLRYIARNPIPAGIAETAAAWPWSAHRVLAGLVPADSLVARERALEHLPGPDPRGGYVALVERSDDDLLWDLRRRLPGDRWLVAAIDHHRMDADAVADAIGVTPSTVYRRLAAARRRPVPLDAKCD